VTNTTYKHITTIIVLNREESLKRLIPLTQNQKAHHYTYKEEKERITFFSSRQNEKLKRKTAAMITLNPLTAPFSLSQ
jgi:hypothetical protein